MYLIIDCGMCFPYCIIGYEKKADNARKICEKLNKRFGSSDGKIKATFEDIENEESAVYCYVEIEKYEE